MTFLLRSRTALLIPFIFVFSFLANSLQADTIQKLENKPKEIILWHSMDGTLGNIFQSMITDFNAKAEQSPQPMKIILKYQGSYDQTLEKALKILNTKDAPHILQVYEMGNLVMQAHPQAYVPLNKLSAKPSPSLHPSKFIPVIREFYKARYVQPLNEGSELGLPSLPFSASSVVLFYNKNAFKRAGLDPEHPPKTWEEFEKMALVLKKMGAQTVLAAGWLSGHHIDQTGAWHNQAVATKGNGVDGDDAKLTLNHPFFQFHLKKLAEWYQAGIFNLETGAQAEKAFANEDILILSQGANRLSNIEALVASRFEIGVGFFPYWEAVIQKPQNTIAGGASFWALAGHTPEEYQMIQSFFEYLADPKIQAEWHQKTCYLPIVKGAESIATQNKFYAAGLKGKAAKIAIDSFAQNPPKEYSRGILLFNFPKIREVMIQEMKEAIRGNKSTESALQEIERVGNELLQKQSIKLEEKIKQ